MVWYEKQGIRLSKVDCALDGSVIAGKAAALQCPEAGYRPRVRQHDLDGRTRGIRNIPRQYEVLSYLAPDRNGVCRLIGVHDRVRRWCRGKLGGGYGYDL